MQTHGFSMGLHMDRASLASRKAGNATGSAQRRPATGKRSVGAALALAAALLLAPLAAGADGSASFASKGAARPSLLPNVSGVAARLRPSVVNISVSGSQRLSVGNSASCDEDEDDEAEDSAALKNLLRQFQRRFGILPSDFKVPIQAEGSGLIIRADGVILTNAHVVAGAEDISVRLTDHREYPASIVGVDVLADIALLKIDAAGLPVAKLARAPQPEPGEWVVAIGSPFGFESSVTAGVVSAARRFFPDEGFVPFIQSDVAVNPGSSGGPLANMRGEVIGINAQFLSRTGNFQGLSFAIPIDIAYRIGQQILNEGGVRHARLGLTVQDLSEPLARSFSLLKSAGALVVDVTDDSPASQAGLEPGDVVLAADGRAIGASGELSVAVLLASPGQAMALGVWHRGAFSKLQVRLDEAGAKPEPEGLRASAAQQSIAGLGLVLSPLDPEDQRRLKTASGVLVKNASGAAEHAGVRAGDILLALNAMPIRSLADAMQAASVPGNTIAALIQHGREKRYVPLQRGQ